MSKSNISQQDEKTQSEHNLDKISDNITQIINLSFKEDSFDQDKAKSNKAKIRDLIIDVCWKCGEITPNTRFIIREYINDKDWEYISLLRNFLNSANHQQFLEQNVQQVVTGLKDFQLELGKAIQEKALKKIKKDTSNPASHSIGTIIEITRGLYEKEAVRFIKKDIEMLLTGNFNSGDKFDKIALFKVIKVIGEYSKDFSQELKDCFPNFPWSDLENIRDIMEHPDGVVIEIINGNSQDQKIQSIYQVIEESFLPDLDHVVSEINQDKKFSEIIPNPQNLKRDYNIFSELQSGIETFRKKPKTAAKKAKPKSYEDSEIEGLFVKYIYNEEEKSFLEKIKKGNFDENDKKEIKEYLRSIGYSFLTEKEFKKKIDENKKLPKEQKADISKVISDEVLSSQETRKKLSSKIGKSLEIKEILKGKEIQAITELTSLLEKEGLAEDKISEFISEVRDRLNLKERASKLDLLIEQLDDFLLLVENKVSNGESYVSLIRNHQKTYLTIQGLIENLMDAQRKNNDKEDKGLSSYLYDTVSPRRIQLLWFFRHGIAHSPEKVDDDLFEKFFRDLVSLTKIDAQRRKLEVSEKKSENLIEPKRIDTINEESGAIILANAEKLGFKNNCVKVIGKQIGSEIGSGCDIDLIIEYDSTLSVQEVESKRFRLIELELELGKLLNCHVRVRDWNDIEMEKGREFSEDHIRIIKENSKTITQILIEEQFRRDLESGSATRFLFAEAGKPSFVRKGEQKFTEQNIKKASLVTFVRKQEEYEEFLKARADKRKSELEANPLAQELITKKAQILEDLIKNEKKKLGDKNFKQILTVIKFDKALDKILDEYFLSHHEEILKLYDAKIDSNDFAMAKYNFRRDVRAGNFVLIKDQTSLTLIKDQLQKREKLIKEVCEKYKYQNIDFCSSYDLRSDDGSVYKTKQNESDVQILTDAKNQLGFVKVIYNKNKFMIPASLTPVGFVTAQNLGSFSAEEKQVIQFWRDYKSLNLLFDEVTKTNTVKQISSSDYSLIESDLVEKFCDPSDYLHHIRTRDGKTLHKMSFYDEILKDLTLTQDAIKLTSTKLEGYIFPSEEIKYRCLDAVNQAAISFARHRSSLQEADQSNLVKFDNMEQKFADLRSRHYDRYQSLQVEGKAILSPDIRNLSDLLKASGLKQDNYPGNFDEDNSALSDYIEFENLSYKYQLFLRRESALSEQKSRFESAIKKENISDAEKHAIGYELKQIDDQISIVVEAKKNSLEEVFNCRAIQKKYRDFVDLRQEEAKSLFLEMIEKELYKDNLDYQKHNNLGEEKNSSKKQNKIPDFPQTPNPQIQPLSTQQLSKPSMLDHYIHHRLEAITKKEKLTSEEIHQRVEKMILDIAKHEENDTRRELEDFLMYKDPQNWEQNKRNIEQYCKQLKSETPSSSSQSSSGLQLTSQSTEQNSDLSSEDQKFGSMGR